MKCKNCGHITEGKFCSHCGQNSTVGRINLANVLNEFSESIFQINKGFLYTLKELFTRPGNSLIEYLNGKRKNHFKPFAYLLTLSTIYFLIAQMANQNTWLDDLIVGWMSGATGQNSEVELFNWFAKNYAYSTLLLLPVFSFSSYLAFSKFDQNYLEHLVVNSYITGHQAIIYAFFAILGFFVEHDIMQLAPLLLSVSYAFWVFWQFFTKANRMSILLRSILTYILYLIFSSGLLLLLVAFDEIGKH